VRRFWNWIRDDGGGRVLRLDGPIDEESFWGDEVTPKAFRDELYAEEGDVTIYINSPGGNVFCAAELYTMIRDYPGNVTVKIDALAASAASVVAMAGDRVMISPVGMIMLHDPMTIAMGNAKAMEKAISTLNEVKESIINAYCAKTGLSRNKVAKLMSDETWLNARKAVELGFADAIMFDNKKSEPEAAPDEQEGGDTDGDDDPEEEKDGGIHLNAHAVAESLEGMLYSTRLMGQTILNRIGGFEPNLHQSDEQVENEAPPGGDEDDEAPPGEGEAPPSEEQPERGAAPVAEDSAAQEEPVAAITADAGNPIDAAEPVIEEAAPIDATAIADPSETIPAEEVCQMGAEHATPAAEQESARILPEGFIAIDMNGRTPDGSVPYFILKNQLDRMR